MRWIACTLLLASASTLMAHPGHKHGKGEKIVMINEHFAEEQKTDGTGDWVFKYRSDLSTVPVEEKFLLAAHGGFATDPATNITYFGLPGAGVIQVSPDLSSMKVIGGDTGLFNPQGELWNYHNTCMVEHAGTKYLGLAGNNSGRVWIVGLDGKIHNTFTAPPEGNGQGATDLVQIPKSGCIKITYGYGDNFIYEASPFAGDLNQGVWNVGRFGGKGPREKAGVFNTPHGIALFPGGEKIAIADREYGRVQITDLEGTVETVWDLKGDDGKWPFPCDANFSPDGTIAVVGNLNDTNNKPANFLIVDVKTGKTLSSVTPATLGVPNSRHIHNATFRYVDIGEGKTEVYVLCLFWNPGGYGVFQKVQPWHKPATT